MGVNAKMKPSINRSLFLLASVLAQPLATRASPFPSDFFSLVLVPRQCENACGFYGQVCCEAGQECYTDGNGDAACRASTGGSGNGQWEYWTTTYVQTDLVTITSTGSRFIAEPTPGGNVQCRPTLGESPCGGICCSAAQACESGTCVEAGGSPIDTVPGPTITPPSRPTSTIGVTVTASATMPFIPAVGTDGPATPIIGGGGGLSGGAIAGIVIGSLAGAFILLLLCLCFCVGGFFNTVRGLLGLRGGSRSSSYTGSTRSSAHGRTWFGFGGRRRSSSRASSRKKKKGVFGIGLILAALAVALGLRKKRGRSEKSGSRYGSSYYYSGSYSSSSSSSSSHH